MPSNDKVYLAVDLGASSGRVVAGLFDGTKIALHEVHRFDNGPVHVQGKMYWDILALWNHIQNGLRIASQKFGKSIRSVGVDTWGVDFGLLGRGDELLGNPRHYRDPRTQGLVESALNVVSRADIFAQTGLQFMELNTLFQLTAMQRENSPLLEMATDFLMMPDLFHWLLTGEKVNEFTIATTTQFFNPASRNWATELLREFNIPTDMLGHITPPGTRLGKLRKDVANSTGLANAKVVLPGTHDTAHAVMAVPAAGEPSERPDWCYISSGTWSLMGVEIPRPVINDKCLEFNFTNEGGVGDTIRLLKNIGGLWLVQECRRIWAQRGKEYSWDRLTAMADDAAPLVSIIDPDDPAFTAPQDMPKAIQDYCARSNQPVPESEGAMIRCALEGLALRYRMVLGWLEDLTGARLKTVHIVGGGTQNHQLCQMTADACNRHVIAGPAEATAVGNLMMQAISSGDVNSIASARELVAASFDVHEYEPLNPAAWDEPFERFISLTA